MKPCVLQHVAQLQAFALSNLLVAFDYDGTLAPIAPTPEEAVMRDDTRRLLVRVADRYPCVVISGRALDDLTRRLDGIPLWYVFGNHGLESSADSAPPVASAWLPALRERLPRAPGLVIEDKGYTLTLHYRDVADKPAVIAAIHDAARGLPGARTIAGIEAISLLPQDGRHKGLALQEARRQFACDTALYVGDDETDEDAFQSADRNHLLSVRIGRSHRTTARYRLDRQGDIDAFLHALVVARDERRPPRRLFHG
jgi:trehalose 6-phosphate phosphatase